MAPRTTSAQALKKINAALKSIEQIIQPVLYNNSYFYNEWEQAKDSLKICKMLLERTH